MVNSWEISLYTYKSNVLQNRKPTLVHYGKRGGEDEKREHPLFIQGFCSPMCIGINWSNTNWRWQMEWRVKIKNIWRPTNMCWSSQGVRRPSRLYKHGGKSILRGLLAWKSGISLTLDAHVQPYLQCTTLRLFYMVILHVYHIFLQLPKICWHKGRRWD